MIGTVIACTTIQSEKTIMTVLGCRNYLHVRTKSAAAVGFERDSLNAFEYRTIGYMKMMIAIKLCCRMTSGAKKMLYRTELLYSRNISVIANHRKDRIPKRLCNSSV